MRYIGRFAPSPTGPLHFGSLVAAVASYCDARANQGKWLVRMEDLDKPREVPGAADNILEMLTAYGFEWDGEVMYQSQRNSAYQNALDNLHAAKLIYPCTCSRKQIANNATQTGIEGVIYPRTCLEQALKTDTAKAWRIKTNANAITFDDAFAGPQTQRLANDVGDFVLKRADDFFAYQLAVVVDDAEQGVTHVVRGADLLDSTARQIFLQQALSLTTPFYAHIPLAVNQQGEKLSKQTQAAAITAHDAIANLSLAFAFLKLSPPKSLLTASITDNWDWAFQQWHKQFISK